MKCRKDISVHARRKKCVTWAFSGRWRAISLCRWGLCSINILILNDFVGGIANMGNCNQTYWNLWHKIISATIQVFVDRLVFCRMVGHNCWSLINDFLLSPNKRYILNYYWIFCLFQVFQNEVLVCRLHPAWTKEIEELKGMDRRWCRFLHQSNFSFEFGIWLKANCSIPYLGPNALLAQSW